MSQGTDSMGVYHNDMSKIRPTGSNDLISLADKYGEAQRMLAIASTTLVRKMQLAPQPANYQDSIRLAASDLRIAEQLMIDLRISEQGAAQAARKRCDGALSDLHTLMSRMMLT